MYCCPIINAPSPHTSSDNIRATSAEETSAHNTRQRVTQPANEADDPITIAAAPSSAIRHDDDNVGDVDMEELDMYGEGDLNLIGEEIEMIRAAANLNSLRAQSGRNLLEHPCLPSAPKPSDIIFTLLYVVIHTILWNVQRFQSNMRGRSHSRLL